MMGRGGGGRDRFRRDYQSRMEERSVSHSSGSGGRFSSNSSSRSGGGFNKSNAPPSRHLWVGNLAHGLGESELTHHFLRFGDLESVAFQHGRSYAFLNFVRDEDAIDAIEALQGFPLAGNPLRIEFAKADKSPAPSHNEDHYQYRDEQHSGLRESSYLQKEYRARHARADQIYADNSSMADKNTEPSAVLWVGFPASLNVDETILRRAFSPFGEIENITAFPGRSYAFVRFRSVISACEAKDTLHGKLFGNPRVHICFAKSESGSSNSGRNSMNIPPSPHFKLSGRQGSSESFRQDRKFGNLNGDPNARSPQLFSNFDSGDFDPYSSSRKGTLWTGGNNTSEHRRFGEVGSERELSQDLYEYESSPTRGKRGHLHDFSERFPQTSTFNEEPWDLPEDVHYSHGAKKLKTGYFPSEKELPEYPFYDHENEKHVFPGRFSDFSQADRLGRKFDAGPYGDKQFPDRALDIAPPQRERSNHWKESYDSPRSGSLLVNSVEEKRLTPESELPSLKEWKWEGTIAKGGSPVCRARCFPVGKVLDIMLPEFLDCTARTGLDMLSKHYYQAANAWVVFFVPETDADIGFYNEFMHYLEEKERAAVAKLDEKTTLFLVPPSNFSQKVLKVPGKLSISGVILSLEHPGSNVVSFHQQHERDNTSSLSFPGTTSFQKPATPSHSNPSLKYYPDFSRAGADNSGNVKPAISTSAHVGSKSDNFDEGRHEFPHHGSQRPVANWSSSHVQNSVSDNRSVSSQAFATPVDSIAQRRSSVRTRTVQETSSVYSTGGSSSIPISENSKSSLQDIAALQPAQLVQLASSLLGQQRQSGSLPTASTEDDPRRRISINESDKPLRTSHGIQNNQINSNLSTPQFDQFPQSQQTSNMPATPHMVQRDNQTRLQGNQHLQGTSTQEADSDPQKRLQATLQLAATLLQQIQGKGS